MKVHISAGELYPYYHVTTTLNKTEHVFDVDDTLLERLKAAKKELNKVQEEIRRVLSQADQLDKI